MEHNGIFSNANLHDHEQPTHMESELPDSRKRSLETPAEEAGCTKRTNTGGKRDMSHPLDTLSTRRLRPAHHTVCVAKEPLCGHLGRLFITRSSATGRDDTVNSAVRGQVL